MIGKLPPGLWRVVYEGEQETWIVDADGGDVLSVGSPDCLLASPDVFRAIEAIPLLVEASREMVECLKRENGAHLHYETVRALYPLRDALAAIDERSGIVETPT